MFVASRTVLKIQAITESETYQSSDDTMTIPYLASSVIHNAEKKEVVVFALNRSLEEDMELALTFENFEGCKAVEHVELYCDDLKAMNTEEEEKVAPANVEVSKEVSSVQKVMLKKHSWNMIKYQYK